MSQREHSRANTSEAQESVECKYVSSGLEVTDLLRKIKSALLSNSGIKLYLIWRVEGSFKNLVFKAGWRGNNSPDVKETEMNSDFRTNPGPWQTGPSF